jgi:hypothetical protein
MLVIRFIDLCQGGGRIILEEWEGHAAVRVRLDIMKRECMGKRDDGWETIVSTLDLER